ncbi:MAG: peptidoglycan-binding protein [Myxococcales bacterium]|nr:peptidoglycan-binding protein [Myxococcales bacterium]
MADAPSESAPPGFAWGLRWLSAGVVVTLASVFLVEALRNNPDLPAEPAPSAPAKPTPQPLVEARAHFAELYMSYLLRTYYVPERGFCRPLLERLCESLHRSGLITEASACRTLPNDRFVLAIGRYQNQVGLPVDGKAGPETVRMILGGTFVGREGMREAFCRQNL